MGVLRVVETETTTGCASYWDRFGFRDKYE